MISFTKCYKEATDEQRAGLILDSAFMAEVEQLKKAYNGEVLPGVIAVLLFLTCELKYTLRQKCPLLYSKVQKVSF